MTRLMQLHLVLILLISSLRMAKARSALGEIEDINGNAISSKDGIQTRYEMDMKLTPLQIETISNENKRQRRGLTSNLQRRWPNGIVNYTTAYYRTFFDIFGTGYRERDIKIIEDAIKTIEKNTCIKFNKLPASAIPKDGNYVVLFKGFGCWSRVGFLNRGAQALSLGYGCVRSGIVIHELLHTLGFFHEHSRPDRDQYIRINMSNIIERFKSQFRVITSINSRGVAYDTSSIMHYGEYAGSKDRRRLKTIESLTGGPLGGDELTASDIEQINVFYECSTTTTNSAPTTTTTATTLG